MFFKRQFLLKIQTRVCSRLWIRSFQEKKRTYKKNKKKERALKKRKSLKERALKH